MRGHSLGGWASRKLLRTQKLNDESRRLQPKRTDLAISLGAHETAVSVPEKEATLLVRWQSVVGWGAHGSASGALSPPPPLRN